MSDLLNIEESAAAAAQGWSLSHVYDLAASKWRVQVYALPDCEKAGQFVVAQARAGNAVALKALRLVQASHQGAT